MNALSTASIDLIAMATARLRAGELVAFPTETVYGLGADADNPQAVARLYAVKGRPVSHPVIVHVAPEADLEYWAVSVPEPARRLIAAFWPGPLTLILKRAPHIGAAVSGGQDSIGLRCPSHPVAQQLLRAFTADRPGRRGGVAAPSANKFGHVSPTLSAHVRAEFPQETAVGMLVLEGGASDVGIESTIIDLSRLDQGVPPVLLRPGQVSATRIAAVLGAAPAALDSGAPRASGTLRAHYAPRTPLLLASPQQLEAAAMGAGLPRSGRVVVLAYTSAPTIRVPRLTWRQVADDPVQYARMLYATLRELDDAGYVQILLQSPPSTVEWAAVNDRIGRAAAAFGVDNHRVDWPGT
jgi:L-threonylcarbamoyladenylate synthase